MSTEAVYGAELTLDRGQTFGATVQVQEYVDDLCSSDWWSERFPGVVRIEVVDIRSRCVDGLGRPVPENNAGVIGLTRDGRTELTVLHEIAHVVSRPDAGHGLDWVRTYLELVYRVLGVDTWEALRRALIDRGVDTG